MSASKLKDHPAAREGERPMLRIPDYCCRLERDGCLWRGGCAGYRRAVAAFLRDQEDAVDAVR